MVMDYEELPGNCPPLVKDAHTVLWCYPSTTGFSFVVAAINYSSCWLPHINGQFHNIFERYENRLANCLLLLLLMKHHLHALRHIYISKTTDMSDHSSAFLSFQLP